MKKNIRDVDYVYACTRIKAAEGRGTVRERLADYADAADGSALTAAVAAAGLFPAEKTAAVGSPAEAADEALRFAAELLRSSAPDPSLYDFLFYKYDCNNVKTALKESVTGDHDLSRYFTVGTVSTDDVIAAVSSRDYSALPEHMAARAKEAQDAYETAGDGRAFDLLLDRGCFEDMAASAGRSGVPFFREYVSLCADSANYMTYLRISSSGLTPEAASSLIARAAVEGGTVPCSVFSDAAADAEGHEGRIAELMLRTDSADYRDALRQSDDPDAVSVAFESALNKLISRYDFGSFCPEIPAVFFIKRESEIRAIRTAASMIRSGRTKEEIKKKLNGAV